MDLFQSKFPVIFRYEFTKFAPDISSISVTTSRLFQVHQMTVQYGGCCSHNELLVKFLHHATYEYSSGLEQHTASIFKVTELA